MGKTYTIKEVATLTNLHPNTVRARIKDGILQSELIEGKYGQEYRISEAALAQADMLPITDSDTFSVIGSNGELDIEAWLEKYEGAITRVAQLESERVYLLESKEMAAAKEKEVENLKLELERKKVELETKEQEIEKLKNRGFFKRLLGIE